MGVAGFFFARNARPAARVSPTAPRHKHSEAEIQRSYGAPPRARRRDSRLHRLHMSPAKRLYEPPIFEGRVMLPEVQEQIYEEIIQFERMEYVGPQMRELILDVWPELAHKLPPEDAESPRDEDQTRSPPLPLWHSNADLDPDAVFSLPLFGSSFGLYRSRSELRGDSRVVPAGLDSEAVLAQKSKRSALHHRRRGATCKRRGGNRGRIANRGALGYA
jgi:hypothetical protein